MKPEVIFKSELSLIQSIKKDVSNLVHNEYKPSADDFLNSNPSNRFTPPNNYLVYGNYFTQLTPFLEIFDKNDFIFFDGQSMMTLNGSKIESDYLEKTLNINHQLDFEFNKKKGFTCLKKPLKHCLSQGSKPF